MRSNFLYFIQIILIAGLVGCGGGIVRSEQSGIIGTPLPLAAGKTIGQTFVADHSGLMGIEVFLEPKEPGNGEIRMHLRSGPEPSLDVAAQTIAIPEISEPGYYRFTFPVQADSNQAYYYAFFEIEGEGTVGIGRSTGESYLDGAMYRNHDPLDAQIAFKLVYESGIAFFGLIKMGLAWIGILAIGFFLFILPGWGLVEWVFKPGQLSLAEKLGIAAGIGIALYPVLSLWTHIIGLNLGGLYSWLPPIVGIVLIIWNRRQAIIAPEIKKTTRKTRRISPTSTNFWVSFTLLFLLGVIFATRFWAIRDTSAPFWGDSVQHAMIAQLFVDNHGLFNSWHPYAPYESLTVHFGFHNAVALYSWLTGNEILDSTLISGQLINLLAILTLYPLGLRVADGNRWSGVGAVFVGGLLTLMPAYYLNWGRYSQLSGQAILPVAIWFVMEIDRQSVRDWNFLGITGLTLSGMGLHYYRAPIFLVAFIIAWLLILGIMNLLSRDWRLKPLLFRLVVIFGLFFLFLLPWGIKIAGGNLSEAIIPGETSSVFERVHSDYEVWSQLFTFVRPFPLSLGLLGLIWGIYRRNWVMLTLPLWVLILSSLVSTQIIGLPFSNFFQNFAILIMLYIPIALAGGWLLGEIARGIEGGGRSMAGLISTALFTIAAVWSGYHQRSVSDPYSYALVTTPDLRAMEWIKKNTPAEAKFLVEGFRIYDGFSAVGSDAGWWIPLLAHRENTMPPQYALLNESPSLIDYSKHVVSLVETLEETSPADPNGLQAICSESITHIFIGQRQGKVGSGVTQLFSPDPLEESALFQLEYHQDRVYVFSLAGDACGSEP